MEQFKDLGLSNITLEAIQEKGYTTPTEIQRKAIPILLEGEMDVIGQSQTGTGKTASFALPLLELLKKNSRHVQAIILCPTRELALQVSREIEDLRGSRRASVLAVYGGSSIRDQITALRKGVDIVVGTPGRVMDLMERGRLDISHISYFVLDEADEMLNMGFIDDITHILKSAPKEKRMILFSATMPKPIQQIAQKFMRKHTVIKIDSKNVTTTTVEQVYYEVRSRDRFEGLRRVIDMHGSFYGILFCRMKSEVDGLAERLVSMGYNAAALHGDITQGQREKIMGQLKKRRVTILVATDVAARGIDINDLTHVVNYSLPQSAQSYVHRIGRTGRAGKKGIAISFVMPSERGKLKVIERVANTKLEKKTLPSIDEVIRAREEKLRLAIEESIKGIDKSRYEPLARELLKTGDPKKVVCGVLENCFAQMLDASGYANITAVSEREGRGKVGGSRSRGRDGFRRDRDSNRGGGFRGSRSSGSTGGRSGGFKGSRSSGSTGGRSGGFSGSRSGGERGGARSGGAKRSRGDGAKGDWKKKSPSRSSRPRSPR